MTRRAVDPMRRSLPLAEWPASDAALWALARTPAGLFDDHGGAAHWHPRTCQTNIQHYGRFLGYLSWRGDLDETVAPADRVTRESVGAYSAHLEALVAPCTRLSMLVGLKVMMQAMAPERSWDWLQRYCNRIQVIAKPSRDKRSRMRPTGEIFAAAIGELRRFPTNGLSLSQAVAYRNALMLAFLTARPLRLKNFAALALGRHLTPTSDGWLLRIEAHETKTKEPIAFTLPEQLQPWLGRYLGQVRPLFPEADASQDLWLGIYGALKGYQTIHQAIRRLTERLFGRSINPHLLRDCAASSLANESAETAPYASALLGHRQAATTERWYIQADNLDASRRVNRILGRMR
ncbi:MAG: site-specific integrase [Salinarimonadaceae bacterium]|nr:MAG: site-specific integrase [Salinarimonadaceae bacterium]